MAVPAHYKNVLKSVAKTFPSPEKLREKAFEYFEWASETPLQEQNVSVYKGEATAYFVPKCRALTLRGLASYIGVTFIAINGLRKNPEYAEVMALIEDIIYTQKFENAAAGLLNAGIITRDLGLAEKTVSEVYEAPAPVDEVKVADIIHPDATQEQLDIIWAAGMEPLLFTQEQIDAGVPWTMPPGLG